MINKFEWYLPEHPAQDSMCYDSDTFICSYGTEDNYVQVVIRGYVTVYYKDDRYSHASDMPDELLEMFANGKAYKSNDVVINENNWYEIEWIKDNECVHSDVLELGTPLSKYELNDACKETLKMWQEEEKMDKGE